MVAKNIAEPLILQNPRSKNSLVNKMRDQLYHDKYNYNENVINYNNIYIYIYIFANPGLEFQLFQEL